MRRATIIYWSKTGNTRKVAFAIRKGLEDSGVTVTLMRLEEAEDIDFYDYDLVCVGSPSYQFHPPEPMTAFLKKKFVYYQSQGKVKLGAPKILGKIFVFKHCPCHLHHCMVLLLHHTIL